MNKPIDIISSFDLHMKKKTKIKLSNVQRIVEFYFFFKELDYGHEPFSRYVRAAKKLDTWAKQDVYKVYEVICELGSYFDDHSMNWTLDTIHRYIPQRNKLSAEVEKDHELMEGEDEVERESKRRLAEFEAERKANKFKKSKKK